MRHRLLAVAFLLASLGPQMGRGAAPAVSTPIRDAELTTNAWVKIEEHGAGRRQDPALVYLPREDAFLAALGALGAWNDRKEFSYDELTFRLATRTWTNRFPPGKEGWGPAVGMVSPPAFRGHGFKMADVEKNVRLGLLEGRFYAYSQYALDTDRNRLVAYTMSHTLAYDPERRAWKDLAPSGDPNGGTFDLWWGSLCYDPVNREVVLFGGNNGASEFNDTRTWLYSPEKNAWRRLETDEGALEGFRKRAAGLRAQATALHGACANRWFGAELPERGEADLAKEATALRKSVAALAGDLEGAAARGRPAAGELAVAMKHLAAAAPDAAGIAAALAAMRSLRRAEWCLLPEPPPRAYSQMVYDPASRSIVLFGGDRLDMLYGDTWVYDCATRRWTERRPELSPSPRAGHALLFLPKSKRIVLLGGYGFASETGYWGPLYKQLPVQGWTYDVAGNTWELIRDWGPPGGRKPVPASPPGFMGSKGAAMKAAVDAQDVVVALSQENRTVVTRACRLDPSQTDAAGTRKLGVGPGTVEWRTGPYDPLWYLEGPPPDEAAFQAALAAVPANTWTVLTPKGSKLPRQNRDWGTAVLDPDRDAIYRWSGGHSAHCGTDIPVFSLRTGRYHIKYPPAFPLGGIGSCGSQPSRASFLGQPWISAHSYHSYAYCPVARKMLCTGHQGFTCAYDPETGTWAFGPQPEGMRVGSFYTLTLCTTPQGAVAWERGLFRYDAAQGAWVGLDVGGAALPRPKCDASGMCCDTRRGRLILTHRDFKGGLVAVDLKSQAAERLEPKGAARLAAADPYLRETCYDAANDLVVLGATLPPDADGLRRTPVYDAAANRWLALRIGGANPCGKKGRNVSLGLMFHPRRKLVLAVDTNSVVYALRVEPKAADPIPLK